MSVRSRRAKRPRAVSVHSSLPEPKRSEVVNFTSTFVKRAATCMKSSIARRRRLTSHASTSNKQAPCLTSTTKPSLDQPHVIKLTSRYRQGIGSTAAARGESIPLGPKLAAKFCVHSVD